MMPLGLLFLPKNDENLAAILLSLNQGLLKFYQIDIKTAGSFYLPAEKILSFYD